MAIEVKIPSVGESITSGVVSAWHKKSGELVSEGEALFTLETDKVSTEIVAEKTGILETKVPEGQEVKIGEIVAIIDDSKRPSEKQKVPEAKKAEKSAEKKKEPEEKEREPEAEKKVAEAKAPVAAGDLSAGASARADDRGRPQPTAAPTTLSPAILTTFNECDMSAVQELRRNKQDEFTKKNGVKLGLMSFFVKACVEALKAVPVVNGRIEDEDFIQNNFYDIGVAVGTERGLVVPIVRDADKKSFADLERDIANYATKAREGKLKIEDLTGGTFTISNGGVYGSLL